jgi:transcriptional regulator with XRE-family HTH domain
MNGDQCRAARAILGMAQLDLARLAKAKPETLASFENGRRTPLRSTVTKIRAVLVAHGISFVDDEEGIGVRRRRNLTELATWERQQADRAAREETNAEAQPITPAQCRAARAFLRWTVPDLATRAKVATSTIGAFEASMRESRGLQRHTLLAIKAAFASAGLEFTNKDGAGVRLRE